MEISKAEKDVRKAVAWYLEQDADGGEMILKEVFEQCATSAQTGEVEKAARKIARFLRSKKPIG